MVLVLAELIQIVRQHPRGEPSLAGAPSKVP